MSPNDSSSRNRTLRHRGEHKYEAAAVVLAIDDSVPTSTSTATATATASSIATIARAEGPYCKEDKSSTSTILVERDASLQTGPQLSQDSEEEEDDYYSDDYSDYSDDDCANDLDVTIRPTKQRIEGACTILAKEHCYDNGNGNDNGRNDPMQDESNSEQRETTSIATTHTQRHTQRRTYTHTHAHAHAQTKQRMHHWHGFSTTTKATSVRLSPIAERRVTFAGKMFSPVVPHASYDNTEEKRTLWYSTDELLTIRRNCVEAMANLLNHHHHHTERYTHLHCPHVFRGLESLFDEILRRTSRHYYAHPTCQSRRWDARTAVLEEQHRQRCLHSNSDSPSPSHSQSPSPSPSRAPNQCKRETAVNPERLRQAYIVRGKTNESQWIAHDLAKQDERHARDCWTPSPVQLGGDPRELDRKEEEEDDDDDCRGEVKREERHSQVVRSEDAAPSMLQQLFAMFSKLQHGDVFFGMADVSV
eukprot:jgi/Psemu1/36337/gm1.36337_g